MASRFTRPLALEHDPGSHLAAMRRNKSLVGEFLPTNPLPPDTGFEEANRKIEVVHWLVRLCMDRNLISNRQFLFSATRLEECGRMVGGWA